VRGYFEKEQRKKEKVALSAGLFVRIPTNFPDGLGMGWLQYSLILGFVSQST
jgi:hypothetical protein